MKNYQIYFLNILASGLFYSFVTTKLALLAVSNNLIIISVSALVNLVVFWDLKYFNLFENLSLRKLNIFGLALGILLLFLNFYIQNAIGYLLAYFLTSIIITIVTIIFENEILKDEVSLKNGFINMQLIRTISKLIGFGLGAILSLHSDNSFLFIFIIIMTVNLFNSWKIDIKKEDKLAISSEKITGWLLFIILGILATTTTLWIPLLVSDYVQSGFSNWASIPFVLPGIVTILILSTQKQLPIFQKKFFIESCFILTIILFIVARLMNMNLLFQVILFSLLTAFSISLSVTIRKVFLQLNKLNNQKYILQSLYVGTALFNLFFSLLGTEIIILQAGLIILNLLSVTYIIFRRHLDDEIWDLL